MRIGVDPKFIKLPINELLEKVILNRAEFYSLFTPWMNNSRVLSVRFESLVGPEGGGAREDQIREIINIGRHMGLKISEEKALAIAQELFGGTNTFRKGQIGAWKEEFSAEHKELFKKHAGQLLIDLGYEKDFDW